MTDSLTGRNTATGETILVRFTDGRIASIESAPDQEDAWLAPGLVDLQVNGYCGYDLNADHLTQEIVQHLARRMLATGVTTFLPTLITASEEKLIANVRIIAAARLADPLLMRMIPFVHIEGPHISPEDGSRGAHPREHVRPPDMAEFMRWQTASGNLVGMVTLSPHYANAPEYISALHARGVLVSIGHTSATPDQIHSAADDGARLSTHLGNGVESHLPRHPNLLWAQLADDRLTATLIADGHHLPPDTLTSMLRAKTTERAILISDLVSVAGLPPGEYGTPVGGRVVLHSDGRLNVAGTDYLAGSTTPLKDAVAYVASHTALSLDDAIKLATANPGRFAGTPGSLHVGAPADLIRFRWEPGALSLDIQEVVLQGRTMWPEDD